MGVAIGLERAGDLGDVLVGVAAAEGVHVFGQAVVMLGVAVEEIDVVEQFRAFQVVGVAGEAVKAGEHFVHAAVFAGDVAVPHGDAGRLRHGLEPRVNPIRHALGDLERFFVAADLVAVEQAGEDFVQGVIRRPNLVVATAVSGAVFEHDELIRRIRADEARAPVPVIRADALLGEVGIITGFAGAERDLVGVGVERRRPCWSACRTSSTGRKGCQ